MGGRGDSFGVTAVSKWTSFHLDHSQARMPPGADPLLSISIEPATRVRNVLIRFMSPVEFATSRILCLWEQCFTLEACRDDHRARPAFLPHLVDWLGE